VKEKISMFCNVDYDYVIEAIDANSVYEVPMLMCNEKLDEKVLTKLNCSFEQDLQISLWETFLQKIKSPRYTVRIGLIGKYVDLMDAYKSINEALIHAGASCYVSVVIIPINSDKIDSANVPQLLSSLNGIIIGPGFGDRGIEGKIEAIRYARENNLPMFGICLGMQCMMVEFARNILKFYNAASTEHNPQTLYPVITLEHNQLTIVNKGGTMRLGAYDCKIAGDSLAYRCYNSLIVSERHRHRYEFNSKYLNDFKLAGMKISGINPESELVEIVELENHPWFLGVQFHPEFKSTPLNPHPLFQGFVKAVISNLKLLN